MRGRVRAWLDGTHGRSFELTRHFLCRLFDSDLVATPGEWARVAAGVIAVAASTAILIAPLYIHKYALAREEFRAIITTPGLYLKEVRADELSLVALAMAATATLTALLWQSLFPTRRDYLALASLPLRSRQLFTSKFAALLLLFAAFALSLTVPSAVLFAQITQGQPLESSAHVLATLAAWSGACAFTFFSLVAVQGALLNLLPVRWFDRVSLWVQSLVLGAAMSLVCVVDRQPSTALWWPPNWFVNLWAALAGTPGGQSGPAVMALVLAPVTALTAYGVSYHRHTRLLLETSIRSQSRAWSFSDWFVRRWIADPREQAMFGFMWRSLLRSRAHRLALAACVALAVALNVRAIADGGDPTGGHQYTVVFGPMAMAMVSIAGFRYLFSLPVALEANWIFRMSEAEGRASWLHAVERFVLWCGVAPIFAAWMPAAIWALGAGAAVAGIAGLAFVLLFYELLFSDWRKAPFTCSYLPGKRPVWWYILIAFGAPSALSLAALVALGGVFYPPLFFVVITILTVVWRRARDRRLGRWRARSLIYEEAPDPEVLPLGLRPDAPVGASPSDQGMTGDDLLWPSAPAAEGAVARLRRWLRDFPTDMSLGLRLLTKKPGFSATVVITLALGLGLNTAFFTVYNAFCLKPVSVRDPYSLYEYSEWVSGTASSRNLGAGSAPAGRYNELRKRTDILAEAMARTQVYARLNGRLSPGWMVSGNYFSMLGAGAIVGRLIGAQDETPVMVLSYRAWRSRFGGDPSVPGRKIDVGQVAYTVIGVTRPEFLGVATDREPDFWVPLSTWQVLRGTQEPESLSVVVRLKPGVARQTAKAALIAASRQGGPQRQAPAVDLRPVATLLDAANLADLTFIFLLIFAFTMAIPCANTANMMLARGWARQQEIGVRLALGAGRGRLMRQFMTESFILVVLAGLGGVAVARVAVDLAVRTVYSTLPSVATVRLLRLPDLGVDHRVLIYMLGVVVLTVVGFTLAPATQATRWGAAFALRRQFTRVSSPWLREALVVGQAALCLALLICAGLLLRGSARLSAFHPGFDTRDVHVVAAMDSTVPPDVEVALRRQGWVAAIAQSNHIPTDMGILRVRSDRDREQLQVRYNEISPGYLEVLGIPVVRGRDFLRQEAVSRAPMAILSEAAARRLWPGEDPLGKTLRCERDGSSYGPARRFDTSTVIGITRERLRSAASESDGLTVYFPSTSFRGTLLVRGRGDPEETSRRIERLLGELRTKEGVELTVPLEAYLYLDSYAARAGSWLASTLGLLALLLTASGMYGVMSFLVGQRRKEMGIRLAMGAATWTLVRHMLLYSTRLVMLGVSLGLVLALWGAQLISAQTRFVALYDLPAYALGSAVVAVAAVTAALIPALRAGRADPVAALRAE